MSDRSMERSISELKEKIAGLERAIELFESRVAEGRWLVAMLQKTKAPNAGFAFWEWEHRSLASKTASDRLGNVLDVLDARVAGQWEKGERWQEVPGVPSALLYVERPPTILEVYQLVKAAAGLSSNAQVVEMFCRLKEKPVHSAITEYFWAALG